MATFGKIVGTMAHSSAAVDFIFLCIVLLFFVNLGLASGLWHDTAATAFTASQTGEVDPTGRLLLLSTDR